MKTSVFISSLLAASALVIAPGVQAQSWAGSYVGASANFTSLPKKDNTVVFDTNLDGQYGDTVKDSQGNNYFSPGFCDGTPVGINPAAGCKRGHDDNGVALRAGYDWQKDKWIYGVVGEVTSNKFSRSVTAFSTYPDTYTFTTKVSSLSALRGRVGYAYNDWLFYGTAGFAWATIDRSFATNNALNTFTGSKGKDGTGSQIGLGVEKRYGEWSVGLEYLRTSLRDRAGSVRVSGNANTFASNPFQIQNASGTDMRSSEDKIDTDSIMITASYRFGAM